MPQTKKSKPPLKKPSRRQLKAKGWRAFIEQPFFIKTYVVVALVLLAASIVLWALLGARLQQANADQTVNAFLFEHTNTFRQAWLPGQHSFLLKWPLFLLIRLFAYAPWAFMLSTIAIVVATIGGLVLLLHRIERRPVIFATLCLALASVLLLVPAMPYTGGILPVNMAMLTTRNLEYVFFIYSFVLLLRANRLRSWRFGIACLLMGLVIASDKLFLILGIGGALIALIAYSLSSGWNLVSLSAKWLVSGLFAGVVGLSILAVCNSLHLTHILDQASNGPYGLAHNFHDVLLGAVYGALGVLTNFGANPAFDSLKIRDIPHQTFSHLFNLGGLSFFINGLVLVAAVVASIVLIKKSFTHNKHKDILLTHHAKLALMLIWASIAAFGAFIATRHYYAVDARYVTISLFAGFTALAVFSSEHKWTNEKVVLGGLLLSVSVVLGACSALHTYYDQRAPLDSLQNRNAAIIQIIRQHPVDVLVGDYWRVLPAKAAVHGALQVLPLNSCTQARQALSSQQWQPDLTNHNFAYLLTSDRNLTDYPHCTLDEIIAAYGRPAKSTLIDGTLAQPKEQLLFYDGGAHKSAPVSQTNKPSTVLPITVDELPNTNCAGPTAVNIVAHQDDDLLFMNPDILHDLKSGRCIRTVYVTAGDAGHNRFYWLGRMQGSEAAYDSLTGQQHSIWIERIVQLGDNQFITVANPRGNSNISLIFMYLPDGNINGSGFWASQFESLQKQSDNKIAELHSVDGQSHYNDNQFINALTTLLAVYHPVLIRTQSDYVSHSFPDHSDHMAVGSFVKKAYQQYEAKQYQNSLIIPLHFYKGYPVHELPDNVSGEDLAQKEAAFFAYAQFDKSVCSSIRRCSHEAYGIYLTRQYENPY